MSTTPTVFVDLDSTLADTRHRHHMLEVEDRDLTDWVQYAMACSEDVPIPGTVRFLELCAWNRIYTVILSGRAVEAHDLTREWLLKHKIPFGDLIMRGAQDVGSNGEFKVRVLREWARDHPYHEPMLVIDDWPEVRDRMSEIGIPTLLVSPPMVEKPMFEYVRDGTLEELEDAHALDVENPELSVEK